MDGFWTWLQGKKTYIAAAITTVLGIIQSDAFRALILIPEIWQERIAAIAMLFAGLTVAANRSSQAKVEESLVDVANLQLRDLDEREAAEVLNVVTRRIKSTAAKKPSPKPKTKGKP